MDLVHEFELEQSGLADDLFGPFGVLNARQLHQNVLPPATLNDRLAHPELINAVADRLEGLVHGIFPKRTQFPLMQGKQKLHSPGVRARTHHDQVGKLAFDEVARLVRARRRNLELNLRALADHFTIGNAFPLEQVVKIPFDALHGVLDRLFHLHFEDQVASALEIQPQMDTLRRKKTAPPERDLAHE